MVIGYARVSTKQQDVDRQIFALEEYGCGEILSEKISGVKANRPELMRLRDKARKGDTVVVESWSRLGRSTRDLIEQMDWFAQQGVRVVSLKENYDADTPQGRLIMTLFQAFAEFERDLIIQRVNDGIKAARARGRVGGRPTVKRRDVEAAMKMYDSRQHSITEICRITGISQTTLYRYINKREQK